MMRPPRPSGAALPKGTRVRILDWAGCAHLRRGHHRTLDVIRARSRVQARLGLAGLQALLVHGRTLGCGSQNWGDGGKRKRGVSILRSPLWAVRLGSARRWRGPGGDAATRTSGPRHRRSRFQAARALCVLWGPPLCRAGAATYRARHGGHCWRSAQSSWRQP